MSKTQRTVVKKVENAVIYSDGTIRIDNVRASYPHLSEPYSKDGEKGKYGITGILPKETHRAAAKLVKGAIDEMMAFNKTKVATDKMYFKDGNNTDKDEYQEAWIVSSSESRAPSVRARSGGKLGKEQIDEMFYGGCWVNILIRPWYQDGQKTGKGYGKRINAGLVAVQFVRDDESFGDGRIDDEGVWEEEDDDNAFDDDNFDDDDI